MRRDLKASALRRLKIAAGQLRAVERMVEAEEYCVDIIVQLEAVKHALAGVERTVLENHLSTHVEEQIKSGRTKTAVDEVLKVYALAIKSK